ncbi:hypothetical protein LTS08_007239 [Lithohypha guttulata]|uniref:MHD domain-containing protein n=1 Tax=Lithohypha guttulata TaxID=1690604 RepID=A0AAN7T100_9EURO|nr:hypothetical protein LTR05_003994 [Lithohypha guttulata]KAK5097218.1 hypothetical protein LTS08_007239 [Lithohypha guttulata]
MTAFLEALFIFDDQRQCILDHIYNGRPPKASELRASFYSHTAPQPAVLYLSDLNPPTTAYSVRHANLVLIAICSVETAALAILEFLRKITDILEDFLGSPLLSQKIEENYEVVAQILAEVCDAGIICNTEPNALRESVEVSSTLGKLFQQVGISSSSPVLGGQSAVSSLRPSPVSLTNQPSIPWRKSNVRHTSNELYVDIIESLSVVFAPSGNPISARANGSIVFTAKISGVPDILLSLSALGGTSSQKSSGIARTMSLPSFHPCVRLNRWKEKPGDLSFIPPDGKFMLAGYEVDLLPYSLHDDHLPAQGSQGKLFLPATVDLRTGLGPSGNDFEAKLTLNTNFPGMQKSSSTAAGRPGSLGAGRVGSSSNAPFPFGGPHSGTTGAPTIEAVSVSIAFPPDVRTVMDFRPSRGDAQFDHASQRVEWKVPTNAREGSVSGTATLTGTVAGPLTNDERTDDPTMTEYYDSTTTASSNTENGMLKKSSKRNLMPQTISTSFTVKGWLPSGIKVEALLVDVKKSKGLGEGVKPYKGVKYLCVSRKGVERRVDVR